jgi:hypothetical protein
MAYESTGVGAARSARNARNAVALPAPRPLPGKVFRAKAHVIAHDHAAFGASPGLEIVSRALGAVAHVLKGIVLGDAGAPTIGTEDDPVVTVP